MVVHPSNVFVELYDMRGNFIKAQEVCPNDQIELFDLSNGLYTISISDKTKGYSIYKKLTIAK